MMNIRKMKVNSREVSFKFKDGSIVYPTKKTNMAYIILYPTDGFYLSENQFDLIFSTIQTKDKDICISDIEFEGSFSMEKINDLGYEHRMFSRSFEDYLSKKILFENLIYDINGSWGISIFQDFFGIIYAEIEVIEELKTKHSFSSDKIEFIEFLNSNQITNMNFKKEILELVNNSSN